MLNIDTLINARWIIPLAPDDRVLEHHTLAIQGGEILDLLPTEHALEKYQPANQRTLPSHALIPGLINAHTHAAMSLLRGLSDDIPLMR